jgi:two-component system, chemotaxis family, chemotaxis protein CheV
MHIDMEQDNSPLLDMVDSKTSLAGSNKMEILLFSLGTKEIFGINVFKVREVTHTPAITKTPNVPAGVEGMISLRGNIIPVISLKKHLGIRPGATPEGTMIVTEYNQRIQSFLVDDVDRIVRVDWDQVRTPDSILSSNSPWITAITRLPDGRLVSILHVEQVLTAVIGETPIPEMQPVATRTGELLFMVDDSAVARREIVSVLDRLTVKYQQATNGRDAWDKLQALASRAHAAGQPLKETIRVILTDAEMPLMDGYVLTRRIKDDPRFDGIPVVMHSSLSSEANRHMGQQAGVDAYVAKFDPIVLAETLRPFL